MYRLSGSLVVGLLAAAVAQGHFTFIVPEPGRMLKSTSLVQD